MQTQTYTVILEDDQWATLNEIARRSVHDSEMPNDRALQGERVSTLMRLIADGAFVVIRVGEAGADAAESVCIWQHPKTGVRFAVLLQYGFLEGAVGPLDADTEQIVMTTGLAKDAWSKEVMRQLFEDDDAYEVIWRSRAKVAPLQG